MPPLKTRTCRCCPLRLPSELINIALKALGSPYLLGTPIADILNPALTILTTIGYADVVTERHRRRLYIVGVGRVRAHVRPAPDTVRHRASTDPARVAAGAR